MSNPSQDNPLAQYYDDAEEAQAGAVAEAESSLAQYYDEPEVAAAPSQADYDKELSRSFDAPRAFLSGITLGASENIPGLKVAQEDIGTEASKFLGSFIPISRLMSWFAGPAVNLAAKSPVFQRQLTSLANITGAGLTGAVYGGLEKAFKGEEVTDDDLLNHGLTWAAIDAGLQSLGLGGRFVNALLRRAGLLGVPKVKVLQSATQALESSGADLSTPEKASSAFLEFLENPETFTQGERAVSVTANEPTANIFERFEQGVAQPVLNQPPITAKDLQSRKVSQLGVQQLENNTFHLAEPIAPKAANFEGELDSLGETAVTKDIENVGKRAATEQELGENIKLDVEGQLEAAKNEYAPAYELAEEAAGFENVSARNTAREGQKILSSLQEFKTRPGGYSKAIEHVENALEDAGINLKAGIASEVPIDKLMRLSRRLNETINYEALEPEVNKRLAPLVQSLKQDIRRGLKANPEALEMYNYAEEQFIQKSKKFNNPTARRIRREQKPEQLAKIIESPSDLENMKRILSSEQLLQVERELLEKINAMPLKTAQKKVRELEKHLSKENARIARDILASKNPGNLANRTRLAKEGILDDLADSLTTGQRPNKTLKLWETKDGQKLVRDTLKDNPNKEEIIDYLQKQSFSDFASTVITPEGKIDFKKFNKLIQDPAIEENIRHIGGEEAVTFFKQLESNVNKIKEGLKATENVKVKLSDIEIERLNNIGRQKRSAKLEEFKNKPKGEPKEQVVARPILEKEPIKGAEKAQKEQRGKEILQKMVKKDYPLKTLLDKVTEELGVPSRLLLSILGVTTGGAKGLAWSYIGQKMMYKLAQSKSARKSFKKMVPASRNPTEFLAAFEALYDSLEED